MSEILRFDGPELCAGLSELESTRSLAFALLCAQRQVFAFFALASDTSSGASADRPLRQALNQLWRDYNRTCQYEQDALHSLRSRLEGLRPDCDPVLYFAEYTIDCLFYAVMSCATHDAADSATCAQNCYEARCDYVIRLLKLKTISRGQETVIQEHEVVQLELRRQRRDYEQLSQHENLDDVGPLVSAMRRRARSEGRRFSIQNREEKRREEKNDVS